MSEMKNMLDTIKNKLNITKKLMKLETRKDNLKLED